MTDVLADIASAPGTDNAPEPDIASLEEVYLDGTLVLVGCGKAKRDPEDPVDLHLASVGPDEPISEVAPWGETGPAWRAADLYTSSYFAAKREFAETVTTWSGEPGKDNAGGWAILSAEHYLLHPWQNVKPYDTTIDDYGDDPTDEGHWAPEHLRGQRRPDGEQVVTQLDWFASMVAYNLARWVAGFRDGVAGSYNRANTLLVLAGRRYVDPLRERGVFEYGIDRMAGDPNVSGPGRPGLGVQTRFLFEEIDAGGNGEQMAWLSDAVDRLEPLITGELRTEQSTLPGVADD